MPTSKCAYCARPDRETKPVETKQHGKLQLCERCENHCRARGWLKQQTEAA